MKKLTYILLILLCVLCGQAWGADILYCIPGLGTGDNNGSSWPNAYKTLDAAIDAIDEAGDMLYVSGGTHVVADYGTRLLVNNADGTSENPIRIIASANSVRDGGENLPGTSGRTILTSDAQISSMIYLDKDYVEISGFILQLPGSDTQRMIEITAASDESKFSDITIHDGAIGGYLAGTNITISNWTINGSKSENSGNNPFEIAADASGVIKFCTIQPSLNYRPGYVEFASNADDSWDICNNFISGGFTNALYFSGTGSTINFKNNICGGYSGSILYLNAGQTINCDYNIVLPNPLSLNTAGMFGGPTTNLTVGSHNIYIEPNIHNHNLHGYLFLVVDDASSFAYAKNIADTYANPNGQYITATLETETTALSAISDADIQSFINAGNDVFCHAYDDSRLTYTNFISIDALPAVSGQLVISSDTITLYDTDGVIVVGWDARSLSDSAIDTKAELQAAIDAVDGFTASNPASQLDTTAKSIWLADVDISAPAILEIVPADFWADAITSSKTVLETKIQNGASGRSATYTVEGFVCPGNQTSDAVLDVIVSAGYKVCRVSSGVDDWKLDGLKPYYFPMRALAVFDDDGETEALISRNVAAWSFAVESQGSAAILYSHNPDYSEGLSTEEMAYVLSSIRYAPSANGKTRFNDFIDMIYGIGQDVDGNGYTVASGEDTRDLVIAHTYTSMVNLNLRNNSPAINAGTDPFSDGDGDQYDMKGRLVWSDTSDSPVGPWADGVDIGAYGDNTGAAIGM